MTDINWREWNDSAFDEAESSGKPVLLAISAVWCHWCHVMDSTTYSNPAVVDAVNSGFVPVRVDSDRNPDINTRYNMGGWPTLAFLTPGRDVITGATYVPPDQMLGVLDRIATAYDLQRDELLAQARENRAENEAVLTPRPAGSGLLCDYDRILGKVRSAYDPVHAGFGRQQKFPHVEALEALIFQYELARDPGDLAMVVDTLNAMIKGEVFDAVAGGMFRYATRRDWTEPHYEKMLGDNAGIARVLLDAHRLTGEPLYLDTARAVFGYLESTLLGSTSGAFFGSQDADEAYYRTDAGGRGRMVAPRVDSATYVDSNCLVVLAYLKLHEVTGDAAANDRALALARFLIHLPRGEDGSVAHYVERGTAQGFGNLADPVALARAAIECFEVSGERAMLDSAVELAGMTMQVFRSPAGACYDISQALADRRGISRYAAPLAENAELAGCLARLAELTDDGAYRESAIRILDSAAVYCDSHGLMAAPYAISTARLDLTR